MRFSLARGEHSATRPQRETDVLTRSLNPVLLHRNRSRDRLPVPRSPPFSSSPLSPSSHFTPSLSPIPQTAFYTAALSVSNLNGQLTNDQLTNDHSSLDYSVPMALNIPSLPPLDPTVVNIIQRQIQTNSSLASLADACDWLSPRDFIDQSTQTEEKQVNRYVVTSQ